MRSNVIGVRNPQKGSIFIFNDERINEMPFQAENRL